MIWRNNKPVHVYESREGIGINFKDSAVKPVLPITRGELIEHMKGVDYVFSERDIKRGRVVLPPAVIATLVNRPERSILEKPIKIKNSGKHVKKPVAIKSALSANTIMEHGKAEPVIDNSGPRHTATSTSVLRRYLDTRRMAKEHALLAAEQKHEADLTSFFSSFPEATQHTEQTHDLRILGAIVSGLCISIVAVGPLNAGLQSGRNAINPVNEANVATDLYTPYKDLGNALENSILNIQNK